VLEPFSESREEILLMIGRTADLAEEWLASRGEAPCRD
jgi:hypothetical protein